MAVDTDVLRTAIRDTYTDVSADQDRAFIFPTGRDWARERAAIERGEIRALGFRWVGLRRDAQ